MIVAAATTASPASPSVALRRNEEAARAANYPLARWYLRPLAVGLALRLVDTPIRPWHVTLIGFTCALGAAGILVVQPQHSHLAAMLTLAWWFCDRTDGPLARLQATATPLGAWLDGNLDEMVDLGLHFAIAFTAASQGSRWAWPLLLAFYAGKYLLMHSLIDVDSLRESSTRPAHVTACSAMKAKQRLAYLYHLPGNADVRTHLMLLALLSGWFTAELALLAVYYNVRWLARYPLVIARARRMPS